MLVFIPIDIALAMVDGWDKTPEGELKMNNYKAIDNFWTALQNQRNSTNTGLRYFKYEKNVFIETLNRPENSQAKKYLQSKFGGNENDIFTRVMNLERDDEQNWWGTRGNCGTVTGDDMDTLLDMVGKDEDTVEAEADKKKEQEDMAKTQDAENGFQKKCEDASSLSVNRDTAKENNFKTSGELFNHARKTRMENCDFGNAQDPSLSIESDIFNLLEKNQNYVPKAGDTLHEIARAMVMLYTDIKEDAPEFAQKAKQVEKALIAANGDSTTIYANDERRPVKTVDVAKRLLGYKPDAS